MFWLYASCSGFGCGTLVLADLDFQGILGPMHVTFVKYKNIPGRYYIQMKTKAMNDQKAHLNNFVLWSDIEKTRDIAEVSPL